MVSNVICNLCSPKNYIGATIRKINVLSNLYAICVFCLWKYRCFMSFAFLPYSRKSNTVTHCQFNKPKSPISVEYEPNNCTIKLLLQITRIIELLLNKCIHSNMSQRCTVFLWSFYCASFCLSGLAGRSLFELCPVMDGT